MNLLFSSSSFLLETMNKPLTFTLTSEYPVSVFFIHDTSHHKLIPTPKSSNLKIYGHHVVKEHQIGMVELQQAGNPPDFNMYIIRSIKDFDLDHSCAILSLMIFSNQCVRKLPLWFDALIYRSRKVLVDSAIVILETLEQWVKTEYIAWSIIKTSMYKLR